MQKFYFFDRGNLWGYGLDRVAVHPAQGKKFEQNPLFTEEPESKPWELRYDNSYPTVIYDPEDNLYKLFYSIIVEDLECINTPVSERVGKVYKPRSDRVVALGYAQSEDGLHWVKPNLGIVEYHGSKENNLLIINAHGAGVFLDEKEVDKSKRYKLIALNDDPSRAPGPDGRQAQMSVSFSADGIHWSELQAWPEHNPWGDTDNYPFRDPADNKFKVITRSWHHGMRVATLCESEDFINWSDEKPCLHGLGYHDQVYSMPIFIQNGLYLGLASIYHEGNQSAPNYDCVDLELTYAKQPTEFYYAAYGEPFIPRGEGTYHNGEFDCGCIYAAPPLRRDGKLLFYYMGGNGQHTNFRETSFGCIEFHEDKLAYIAPIDNEAEGTVVTAPFFAEGNDLYLLFDSEAADTISVEVRKQNNGVVLEGYTADVCTMETQEDGWTKLTFAKPLSELKEQKLCLNIKLKGTKLYAMKGDVRAASIKY